MGHLTDPDRYKLNRRLHEAFTEIRRSQITRAAYRVAGASTTSPDGTRDQQREAQPGGLFTDNSIGIGCSAPDEVVVAIEDYPTPKGKDRSSDD
jgi:hypothetical protein